MFSLKINVFLLFSIEMSNQNISSIPSNSLLIKLKPDINGRYGFNIKVYSWNLIFEIKKKKFFSE